LTSRTPCIQADCLLRELAVIDPRIALQRREAPRDRRHREARGIDTLLELLPSDGRRDRRILARTYGVGCDECRAATVPQVVEEHFAAPMRLARIRRVARRLRALHLHDDRLGERLECLPIETRCDRRDDVKALAARRLDEALETDRA